jgi:peptidoglycan/LPS O-acetylase OafA/YrhL
MTVFRDDGEDAKHQALQKLVNPWLVMTIKGTFASIKEDGTKVVTVGDGESAELESHEASAAGTLERSALGQAGSYALPYMPQLNALRAFAVMGVLLNHFVPQTAAVVDTGLIGVFLFFVVSGFLITGILLRAKNSVEKGASIRTALGRFYARRFLRIFPLFYLVLLITALLDVPFMRATLRWHVAYLSNFFIYKHHQWVGAGSHFWSLAVEEQFYLFWPLVIILTPRKYLTALVLGTIVAAPIFKIGGTLAGAHPLFIRILPVSCLDTLGMGALLAVVSNRQSFISANRLRSFGFYAGIPLLVIALVMGALTRNGLMGLTPLLKNTVNDLAVSLFSLWLVSGAAAGFKGIGAKLLEMRLLIYIGVVSYGIYVFHFFLPQMFTWMYARGFPSLPEPLNAFLMTTATILLAGLSWRFYERPINNMKRFIPYSR